MNYLIDFVGFSEEKFHTCSKILFQQAKAADYGITTFGYKRPTPWQPLQIRFSLKGSEFLPPKKIIVDFDDSLKSANDCVIISPRILGINSGKDGVHYWIALSCLSYLVQDFSLAYIQGYFITNNFNEELEKIKKFNKKFNVSMLMQKQDL